MQYYGGRGEQIHNLPFQPTLSVQALYTRWFPKAPASLNEVNRADLSLFYMSATTKLRHDSVQCQALMTDEATWMKE